MLEHRPVHNSAVYLVGATQGPAVPPPSPPSPITPDASGLCSPIEELDLDAEAPGHSADERSHRYEDRIAGAVHALNTEATALQSLTSLYAADSTARDGFDKAVEAVTRHQGQKGKLVVVGVGKSGHIAKKLVATFNSLALHASFLHPTEALHGDLGHVGRHDTILFITFSGKTPELLTLLPHIDRSLPLIVLTSHTRPDTCELVQHRPDIILLPAPIHEPEMVSFGVSAPTTSTTVALALGDALALVCSRELHPSVGSVFAKNHPGGAIGASLRRPKSVKDHAVPWSEIAILEDTGSAPITAGDVLKAGYASKSGWIRIREGVIPPGRIRRLDSADLPLPITDLPWLVVDRGSFISLAADTKPRKAVDWIHGLQTPGGVDAEGCNAESIIAVLDGGEVVGVLEVDYLLQITL
ncbi:SIS domain-containing protein [Pleurostoma richardsiae]|uniref:SIS domain-containing protein n=1 Tax=Pleurostoma richardsiae TaxID=41990 RepID=A0AA38RB65_9PEZI|nr:SIS domain-containing protein [Pleurostoma richardsiae]